MAHLVLDWRSGEFFGAAQVQRTPAKPRYPRIPKPLQLPVSAPIRGHNTVTASRLAVHVSDSSQLPRSAPPIYLFLSLKPHFQFSKHHSSPRTLLIPIGDHSLFFKFCLLVLSNFFLISLYTDYECGGCFSFAFLPWHGLLNIDSTDQTIRLRSSSNTATNF